MSGLGTVFVCVHRNLYLGLPLYNDWIMHKCLMALTPCLVCPLCVGNTNTAPSPSPFPFFSPMGRLLSSWPAHGEKRGRGKGMGHCIFCLHRTLYLGRALSCVCGHRNLYLALPLYSDWTLPKFLMALTPWQGCPLCVGNTNTAPSPSPFPFSHPWAGC